MRESDRRVEIDQRSLRSRCSSCSKSLRDVTGTRGGTPAAEAVAAEATRLNAQRVFLLASRTLARETNAVRAIASALGPRFAGLHDDMPAHSPREAVVACANAARKAGTDLLVTVGGGSVTDGGKAVTICLEHDIRELLRTTG